MIIIEMIHISIAFLHLAMNYGLKSVQEVMQWIDRFDMEAIKCKLASHVNTKDLASHFCDWLRIKLAAQPKGGVREVRYEDINWNEDGRS